VIVLSSRLASFKSKIPVLQAMLHDDAHEEGGLGFTNRELLASQRGCVCMVVKLGGTCGVPALPVCHYTTQ
jgi:hypothetical protein